MNNRWSGVLFGFLALACVIGFDVWHSSVQVEAANLSTYSDTITDSNPDDYSNHTFQFTVLSDIAAGGYLELTFPADFTVLAPTSSWNIRNVQLYDDGIARAATSTLSALNDQVIINSGAGGSIRYNLNTTNGIDAGSVVRILVGNHTSNALSAFTSYSSTTGTTTFTGDIEPIQNSSADGTKTIALDVGGDSEDISGEFRIAIVEEVGIGPADTTETIPPYRFNPTPTSTIGGTTLSVEIGLETDELAICKWSTASGTAYAAMPSTFTTTGKIVHSTVVGVTPGQLNIYYVRCIDDEGNFNIDDFLIAFVANDQPTGESNTDGDVEGSGTGTGDTGTGDGEGSGGTTGESDGGADTTGGTSGGGGSGGGSGGNSGEDDEDDTGGGFNSGDAPYQSGDAEVIISGYAFPGSNVYVLVDGAPAQSVRANSSGSYEVTLEEIARGVYTFGIYAQDEDDVKSSTFSTSFTVTGGRTSRLSNINIMPSINVEPDPVDPGQTLTVSGYSIPNANITIENQKENSAITLKTFTTTSGSDGAWTTTIDTGSFSAGTYKIRAKAEQTDGIGIKTNFSDYTFYGVGQAADVPLNADLNRDGSVNLTDFSILLFWWGGDGGDSDPPADINRDGSVSLTDFSIMLFQWTG